MKNNFYIYYGSAGYYIIAYTIKGKKSANFAAASIITEIKAGKI